MPNEAVLNVRRPLTASNEIGTNHTLTGHVNVSTDGVTFTNAPAGTVITFTLANANGLEADIMTYGGTLTALRVHGGMGYSTELDIERYYRDAPLMIVGEGTNEIQLGVIARELVGRGSLP